MQCGIDCIKYLMNYYAFDELVVEKALKEAFLLNGEKGMSIYDFVVLSNQYGLYAHAYKSLLIPKVMPCVLYLRNTRREGHYLLCVKRERFHFLIYDPVIGYKKINKLRLYLFWSHICILCYNETKRGT